MEPVFNLMHREHLVTTGNLDTCFAKLGDMMGAHVSLNSIFSNGWRFVHVQERRMQ